MAQAGTTITNEDELTRFRHAVEGRLDQWQSEMREFKEHIMDDQLNARSSHPKVVADGREGGSSGQVEVLGSQPKGFRVVVILDGDGDIFVTSLMERGLPGGHEAAQRLTASVQKYLDTEFGRYPYQIWVKLFFNKQGLFSTLTKSNSTLSGVNVMEDFYSGLNEASERFIVVDCGQSKEAADYKIRAHLDDDLNIPATFKVFLGGCHDRGYVPALNTHITNGHQDKLILLQTRDSLPEATAQTCLPVLVISDLFLPRGIATVPNSPAPTASPNKRRVILSSPLARRPEPPEIDDGTLPSIGLDILGLQNMDSPKPGRRRSRSHQGSPAFRLADEVEEEVDYKASPRSRKRRTVDPNLTLAEQKLNPKPCLLHYLAEGCNAKRCHKCHDYILSQEQLDELRAESKASPCQHLNEGKPCKWGDQCLKGHACPASPECQLFKEGKCKFSVNLHVEFQKGDL